MVHHATDHVRETRIHETTHIKVGDMEADIDLDIAPLIKELWMADIETCNSCQENQPGIVWIEFLTVDDACKFLDIVARFRSGVNTMYNRIRQAWEAPEMALPFWQYDVYPLDLSVDEEVDKDGCIDERPCGKACFVFACSIRFPQEDYEVVLKRMKRHNARSGAANANARSANPPRIPSLRNGEAHTPFDSLQRTAHNQVIWQGTASWATDGSFRSPPLSVEHLGCRTHTPVP
jgi:hypothetical protein